MKVRFAEIPAEGLRIEIKDESWFPDHELQRTAPVRALVTLKPRGSDRVLFAGRLITAITFDCDRCMANYTMEVDNSFELDLEYAPERILETSEHEVSPLEMEMIYLPQPVIDVFEILSQQVFLMIPEKHLCRESCRGLCSRCGANLNEETCDCKRELTASPFSILKKGNK